ncbi:ABC transporter substrate-binding protein [Naumannella halotolerans]|uniref:ABC transporter substrate-binding protein n=1 Tax=Naumannella halotolerans TaxID=993414 RepID=UPI00370DDF65
MNQRAVFGAGTAVLVSLLLAFSGCSAAGSEGEPSVDPVSSAPTTEKVAPNTMAEGKGSDAADGEFPRTVVHFAGETEIPAQPQRVVVIATGQLDVSVTLGVVPVGAAAGDGAEAVPSYLPESFPELAEELAAISPVGQRTEPNIEAIGALEPDLILMNSRGDNKEQTYEALSQIAPTISTEGAGINWKPDMLLVADALGKREQAETWLSDFETEAATFGQTVDPATTVSFTRLNGDRLRIFQVASFPGSIAEDVGVARPESQRDTEETSVDISPEELDLADASWIFYGVQGGDAAELTHMPLWPTLVAVEEQHAVQVDDDPFFLNAGPTAARVVLNQLKTSLGS